MCGRFTLFEPDAVLSKEFGAPIQFDLNPRYNVAPSQPILAARVSPKAGREFALLRWGLIPSWAKDASIGNRMINARAETVAEKPSFRNAFRHRHCLVPMSGFFEWSKRGIHKQPYFIALGDQRVMAVAGLWVREEGVEPSRPCGHGILSPARLPVPPLRRRPGRPAPDILYTPVPLPDPTLRDYFQK